MASIVMDTLDYDGARTLAAKIRAYWAKRDEYPTVRIDRLFINASPQDEERPIYCVRSDMIGGRPQ